MSRKSPGRFLVLVIFLLLPFASPAQLFKWVDENGKAHYSDKNPGEEIDSKIVPGNDQNGMRGQQTATAALKPVIRPYEKTSRKLHLLDTRYLWKKESEVNRTSKIGVYHSG
jgi:hypothetical protein